MPLYFFDTRDGDIFIEDDIGQLVADVEEAKVIAAASLAELARDVLPGSMRRVLIVEVRDEHKPVLETRLTFEALLLVSEHG